MTDCIFCGIARGETKADIVWEDDHVVAFRDLNPQAPKHFLIIPRKHVANLTEFEDQDAALAGHLLFVAARLAEREGIAESGFRTVINTNRDGGQTVFHVHCHLLGGRHMGWPPG